MFVCKECGREYVKWQGLCPDCSTWNSIVEFKEPKVTSSKKGSKISVPEGFFQQEPEEEKQDIIKTTIEEFTRVSVLPKKSLILIGGEPGIGKSTLMCQLATNIEGKCLYLCGEESSGSVKERVKRVGKDKNVIAVSFFFIEHLEPLLIKHNPDLVILDSIYTTRSEADYNIQSKDVLFQLSFLARQYNFCALVVSHITKDGIIAGPKTLEHMVDVVLYLEGDRYGQIRLLRSIKNRFGPTNETGVFEMTEYGLEEVRNPSALFLSQKRKAIPGSVIFSGISGSRPCLMEVQALVVDSIFPQVEAVGFELKRLKLLLAILQKWCGCNFSKSDIFVNIVGGMKNTDPACDLAVAMAILSSYKQRTISAEVCFFGELGLTGEIRRVSMEGLRVKESIRLGFKKIFANSEIEGVSKVIDLPALVEKL